MMFTASFAQSHATQATQYDTQQIIRIAVTGMLRVEERNYPVPVAKPSVFDSPLEVRPILGRPSNELAEYFLAAAQTRRMRQELSMQQLDRLQKINALLRRLIVRSGVNSAQIRSALTPAEFSELQERLNHVQPAKTTGERLGPPAEIVVYRRKLRVADRAHYRLRRLLQDNASSLVTHRPTTLERAERKTASLYEAALGYLRESINAAASIGGAIDLLCWLDREFDAQDSASLTPRHDAVPRFKESRSSADSQDMPKRETPEKQTQKILEHLLLAAICLAYEAGDENSS
ncbi:MAG: hypothetical protein KGL68_06110 [Burkholderiales bacterium]|nr:hypothetical protein [Burkholderiales bacterium]